MADSPASSVNRPPSFCSSISRHNRGGQGLRVREINHAQPPQKVDRYGNFSRDVQPRRKHTCVRGPPVGAEFPPDATTLGLKEDCARIPTSLRGRAQHRRLKCACRGSRVEFRHHAAAVSGNVSSISTRNGSVQLSSLTSRCSEGYGELSRDHQLDYSWGWQWQQQHMAFHETNSEPATEVSPIDCNWGTHTPSSGTSSWDKADQRETTRYRWRRRGSNEIGFDSARFSAFYPRFRTVMCLGAPYIDAHSPKHKATSRTLDDWKLDSLAATAGESVGANREANEGPEEYSDSTEEAYFIPRPRAESQGYEPDAIPRMSSRNAYASERTSSGLVEPKWPASWGGVDAQETTSSRSVGESTWFGSKRASGGTRHRAREALNRLAAKLKGGDKKTSKGKTSLATASTTYMPRTQQTPTGQDGGASATSATWSLAKVEHPAASSAIPLELTWNDPSPQPTPTLDLSVSESGGSTCREKVLPESQRTAADQSSTEREEASCWYWHLRCCCPEVQVESTNTKVVLKEPRACTTSPGGGKGKSPSRGKQK